MAFEYYINQGQKRLRCGYTTGSCAALAAKAAADMLLGGRLKRQESLVTPKGLPVTAELVDPRLEEGQASCAVAKDAGDDCDATDGMLIYAAVRKIPAPEIRIDGGEGIGRVTKPGLDQPVGSAAINSSPRRMIAEEAAAVAAKHGYRGGLEIVISAPAGREAAARTFNPQLGIEGGISILGTSGIVEPQSVQALLDSIRLEMRVIAAAGGRRLILTPGNYGEAFLRQHLPGTGESGAWPRVKCANFIGEALDFAAELGFQELLLVGHIGKFCKLAAGIMNTHSRCADGRREVFTAQAALAGAGQATAKALMEAATADECLRILEEAGLRQAVLEAILRELLAHTRRRSGLGVEAAIFSNQYGPLIWSPAAGRTLGLEKKQ